MPCNLLQFLLEDDLKSLNRFSLRLSASAVSRVSA